MTRSIRLALGAMILAAIAVGSVTTTAAGGPKLIDSRLASIPTGGLVLHGLTGGGAPWQIEEGRTMLFADGRLHLEVEGLLLLNGTNPLTQGRAILTCSSEAVARSPIVPFSPAGDAEVNTIVDLPDVCLAPAVFFAAVTGTGAERWLAVTGF